MGHALRKCDPHTPMFGGHQNSGSSAGSSTSAKHKKRAPVAITVPVPGCPPAAARLSLPAEDEPPSGIPELIPDGSSTSPYDPRILVTLDDRVKAILRSTWSDDFGVLYDLGTDIYSEIFRLDPGVKKLFKWLDGYDLEKDPTALRQCAPFRMQALRFIQTVSMTIQNSSHLSTITEYLKDIGRRHVQYKDRGFEPGHWQVFETAMCNVTEARAARVTNLSGDDRLLLANAYTKLSRHIVALMTVGFREEEKKRSI